jgi:Tol biopolymer transport system component
MAATDNQVYEFQGFRVDAARRRVLASDGAPLKLRPREFDTLVALLQAAGTVVSKDELLATVWPDTVVEENNLNQAISRLRQVLGDDRKDPRFIATITGRGYQFVCPVRTPASSGESTSEALQPVSDALTPTQSRRGWPAMLALALVLAGAAGVSALLLREDTTPPLRLDSATLVSESAYAEYSPSLSPDGTMMAFVSDRSGVPQIWVKGITTGEAVQLTQGDLPAESPSWSPSSDRVLYEAVDAVGLTSVWVVDALGARPPRQVVGDARSPRFAPDGVTFVFVRGPNGIYLGNLDDGSTRKLDGVPATDGFAEPMPAINGHGDIAFVLADEGPSGNLWLYDARADSFRRLTHSERGLSGAWVQHPAWLPDDETLLYVTSADTPTNTQLWVTNVRTGASAQLTSGVGGYGESTVSREGEVLAYTHARSLWRLVRTDPESGAEKVLLETRNAVALPVIAPDGRELAYFGEQLFTLPTSGGRPRSWSDGDVFAATLPSWSRSEPLLWYYRDRALYRLDTGTGNTELVLEDFHWSEKNWLAVHGNLLAYRIRSRWPGRARSVMHNLDTGEIRTLETDLLPADFSRDGRQLLARRIPGADIVICDTANLSCKPVVHEGRNVDGAVPRWSHDEQRIFFRRARQDKPGHAFLWVVDRDGGNLRELVEVGPYQSANFFFAVDEKDHLIWPQIDHAGAPEIWRVMDPMTVGAR